MTKQQVSQPQLDTAALNTSQPKLVLEDELLDERSWRQSSWEITQSRQRVNKERQLLQEEPRPIADAKEQPTRDHDSTSAVTQPDTSNAAPIGNKLDAFRTSFQRACKDLALAATLGSLDSFGVEDTQNLILDLISALRALPDMRRLPSANGRKNLLSDLLQLNVLISSNEFEVDRFKSLLEAVLDKRPDNIIWGQLYATVRESTPPPPTLPLLDQTPYLHTTGSLVNSSEHRSNFDGILKEELGPIYIGIPGFHDAFFGQIRDLQDTAAAVFAKCKEGPQPHFTEDNGWNNWPADAKERDVLEWLTGWVRLLQDLAVEAGFPRVTTRAILAQPNQSLRGSTADRKLDVGFVEVTDGNAGYSWSDIMVLGELKSNTRADTASKTWRDLGRYAREVFTAQDTRVFALGFSLCGSIMRLWEFDRAGVIASSPFDINRDGRKFVLSMLGFLHMDDNQLGFDPTILTSSDGERYIQVVRNGQSERLVIDQLVRRAACVAGRATTCWKAHCQSDKDASIPLVIKDSWQYPEREEEGDLLRTASEAGVVKVARYYHHETLEVGGRVDDVRGLRKGLDLSQATNYRSTCSEFSRIDTRGASSAASGCSNSSNRRKRSASRDGLPPGKRTCSHSPTKSGQNALNRVHRRVIVRDYGIPIYKAASPLSMLSAIESCIEGYKSLHEKTGLLQGDVSTGNLMLSDGEGAHPWPGFLIDLDLAINETRGGSSGARGKTGTRAFMAIGLLLGEKHTFMHDLESFFWVIFWICIHYDGPTHSRVVPRFEKWNYVDMEELAELKKGVVAHEGDFMKMVHENITQFYRSLAPWINRLRKVVFPSGGRWEYTDEALYSMMQKVLRAAQEDPKVQLMV
ncbi:hypothetical protein BJX63DRAFT_426405 [Aspergillus granulosus]|uniref:Fungal-type protein kinase domain-containing protein n=1 Tax=Aspergillus granulosus TaxID=176169 RepID=A0ABR4GSD2_9EURO